MEEHIFENHQKLIALREEKQNNITATILCFVYLVVFATGNLWVASFAYSPGRIILGRE